MAEAPDFFRDQFFDQEDAPAAPVAAPPKAVRVPAGFRTVVRPNVALGQRAPGNLDPFNRPVLENPDGTRSTTSSASRGGEDGEVIYPTVVDGVRLGTDEDPAKDEAYQHYRKTGENFGTFDTPENADRFAQHLHEVQAEETGIEPPQAEAYPNVRPTPLEPPKQVRMPAGFRLNQKATPSPGYGEIFGEAFMRGLRSNMRAGVDSAVEQPKTPISEKYGAPFEPGTMPNADTGKKLAYYITHGFTESSPELAGGIMGGMIGFQASRGSKVGAALGTGAGAAIAHTVKAALPLFEAELKATPDDPDGALERSLKKLTIENAGTAASFALFGWNPFKNEVGHILFQALGVQPTIAAGEKAATNLVEGKPVGEGVPAAAAEAVPATIIPMAAHLGYSAAMRGRGTAESPPPEPPPPDEPPPAALPPPGAPGGAYSFRDDITPDEHAAAASAAKERAAARTTRQNAGYQAEEVVLRDERGQPVKGIDGKPVTVPVRKVRVDDKGIEIWVNDDGRRVPPKSKSPGARPLYEEPTPHKLYGEEEEPPRATEDLSPTDNELAARTGVDPAALVQEHLGVPPEKFASLPGDAKERLVAAAQRQQSATKPAAEPLLAEDILGEEGRGAEAPRDVAGGPTEPVAPPNSGQRMQGREQPTDTDIESGPYAKPADKENLDRGPQKPYARAAAGGSERPFKAKSSAASEHDAFFEERARAKTAADRQANLDDLMRKWAEEDRVRQKSKEKPQREGDEAAKEYGKAAEFSRKHAPPDKDGRYPVDKYGYVMSDKGTPIQFPDHTSAARWILDHGSKSPDQIFDRATHPVGTKTDKKGRTTGTITIKQVGTREGPGEPPKGQGLVPTGKGGNGGQGGKKVNPPKGFSVRTKAPPRPRNIIDDMKAAGGLAPSGETKARDLHKSYPGLVRKGGLSEDAMRDSLSQKGYSGFDEVDPTHQAQTPHGGDTARMWNMVDDHSRTPQYSPDDMHLVPDWEAHLQDETEGGRAEVEAKHEAATDPVAHDKITEETDHEIDRLVREVESGEWNSAANRDEAAGDSIPFEREAAPEQAKSVPGVGDEARREPAEPARSSEGLEREPGSAPEAGARDRNGEGASQPRTEKVATVEGKRDQFVIPGTEQSAKQAAAARETKVRGKIVPKTEQKDADHGMFAAKPDDRQGVLVGEKAVVEKPPVSGGDGKATAPAGDKAKSENGPRIELRSDEPASKSAPAATVREWTVHPDGWKTRAAPEKVMPGGVEHESPKGDYYLVGKNKDGSYAWEMEPGRGRELGQADRAFEEKHGYDITKGPEGEKAVSKDHPVKDERGVLGDKSEDAYRTVEEIEAAAAKGELKRPPENEGKCYPLAGKRAMMGEGKYVIGRGGPNGIWHAVVMKDGKVWDPAYNKWFDLDAYREAVGGYEIVHEMTGREVSEHGQRTGKWPDPSNLELTGERGTRANPADATPAGMKAARNTVDHDATPAQKAAGNYQKGHMLWNGLEVTIETGKGHDRVSHEMGPDGKPKWSVKMPVDYGYIKRTEGADGEGVDIFIGPDPTSKAVWVIDQQHAETKAFDEHKVMAGFKSEADAVKAYKDSFSDGKGGSRIKSITYMVVEKLKSILDTLYKKKPVYQGTPGERGGIELPTIQDIKDFAARQRAKRAARTPPPNRVDAANGPSASRAKAGPLKKLGERYSKAAEKILVDPFMKRVGWRFDALGRLPWKTDYMIKRYLTLGKVARIDETIGKVYDSLRGADADQAKAIYDYLTTKNAGLADVPADFREAARIAKTRIDQVGRALVARELLPQEVYDEHAGSYLPRLYLKHVLGDDNMRALGSGKKPSDMGYLKKRKDIDEETRMLILGEIQDPAFLASQGIGKPMRDIAILDFLNEISQNKEWALPESFVDWRGKKVSAVWLKGESQRVAEMAVHLEGPNPGNNASGRRDEALALSREMANTANAALEHPANVPDQYRQVPDTMRYGVLRGMWIRKEIYDDLIGSARILPRDAGTIESILGTGGLGTKATQMWKMSKVALNPPTQVRNFLSNGVLLQLSGVPMHKVPNRIFRAISEMRNDGSHWKVAKKYGVKATTFTSAELTNIHRELRDLQARTATGNVNAGWQKMRNVASIIGQHASDFYGLSESVFKTAKIIDAMEREGKSEAEAALEAQQAIFDYSLVPKNVRYLRSNPIGVPFISFWYKSLGQMAKVAALTPWRFAPYVALTAGLNEILQQQYDVSADDLQALMMAMPKWLQEKGGAYLMPFKDEHGRWQVLDLGYLFPWQTLQQGAMAATEGDPQGIFKALGIFGAPLADLIVFAKTGIDPFTGKQVMNEFDPPALRLRAYMNYMWGMAAPTWITDNGVAGQLYHALWGTGEKKRGEPDLTPTQAAWRGAGVNIYPIDPESSRKSNIKYMDYEMSQVTAQRNRARKDHTKTPEQRDAAVKQYNEYLATLRQRKREYKEQSKVHPNLRTTPPENDTAAPGTKLHQLSEKDDVADLSSYFDGLKLKEGPPIIDPQTRGLGFVRKSAAVPAQKVLGFISEKSKNAEARKLAASLADVISVQPSTNIRTTRPQEGISNAQGSTDVNTGQIELYVPSSKAFFRRIAGATATIGDGRGEETVMHEAVHAVVVHLVNANDENIVKAIPGLERIWRDFRSQYSASQPDRKKEPVSISEADRSLHEFVAYSLTNPKMQEQLKSMPYRGSYKTKDQVIASNYKAVKEFERSQGSLWGRLVGTVSDMIHDDPDAPPTPKDITYLDAVMDAENNLFQKARYGTLYKKH